MSHSKILEAIQTIKNTLTKETLKDALTKESLTKDDEIIAFIQWFLVKKQQFLIYAGAGTSSSVYSWSDVDEEYRCHSKTWRGLLIAVYEGLDGKEKKAKFLKSASAKIEGLECLKTYDKGKYKTVQELNDKNWLDLVALDKNSGKNEIVTDILNKLGPFRFAWSLRWTFSGDLQNAKTRNEALSKIVNKPIEMDPNDDDIYKVSKLLPEVVKLPFRGIITTNYDDYIEWFIEAEDKRKRNNKEGHCEVSVVYNGATLNKSFQKHIPKLFYLHGKADTDDSNLIFDKYDYANLFVRNNEVLNYLIMEFLQYGVLYIGFGLDDQTFDHMESQIKFICEKEGISKNKLPISYAFIKHPEISKEEKQALRELFNIIVIEYADYDDVSVIIKNINKIIQYTKILEIEWMVDSENQQEAVKRYKKTGIQHYLNGDLKKSEESFEKALGYTMFWDCQNLEDIQQICDLRRRLALTRSKRKWEDAQKRNSISGEATERLIARNVKNAKTLIETFKKANPLNKSKSELIIEEYMVNMLEARLEYHSGAFSEALDMFTKAQIPVEKGKTNLVKTSISKINKSNYIESDIKLLETYYFAQCQIDRANAMLENPIDKIDMAKVATKAMQIHTELKKSRNSDENDLRIKEFGNIVVIAKWAVAYGKLRNFGRFVDKSSPAKIKQNLKDLEDINEILEDGWDYANCKGKYEDPNPKHKCLPSPRWETVKHRSRCRALALIWFNDPVNQPDKLTDAYKSVQKAIELTYNKPDLDFQHIRNLLEAVRLNALTNFVENNSNNAKGTSSSSMCFAASYHYLKTAFERIEKLQTTSGKNTNPYISWILIQAYEIGSVWKLIFNPFLKQKLNDKKPKLLSQFLKESNDKNFVEERYKEFGRQVLNDENKVKERVDSFKEVFDKVKMKLSA